MTKYTIGEQRGTLAPATRKTHDKLVGYIERHGPQTLDTLKLLSTNHKSGDGSNSDLFAPYAIKLGWFVKATG